MHIPAETCALFLTYISYSRRMSHGMKSAMMLSDPTIHSLSLHACASGCVSSFPARNSASIICFSPGKQPRGNSS